MRFAPLVSIVLSGLATAAPEAGTTAPLASGNRLTYLDRVDPYYVSRSFPKLTTPQWVGEPGVEAVVVLAIDDMRGHEKYEAFLRPILERLKRIDGRAALSIMTNQIDPAQPHLQTWLKEGLSLECHTFDHPCPLLREGNFVKAKETYDRCVDHLGRVPASRPVAFRMPCCDSLNTLSPRFFAEIFNARTPSGNFLALDSSVFQISTSNDPELPREVVTAADGTERFRKYLPFEAFATTIEDYPYPYVIGRLCWEFPCIVPSDWEAQHVLKPNNPRAVEDLKHALDAVVAKQGVFNLVFHPHGWIRAEQIVELIDYAVEHYGRRIKFLNFREAHERLASHLLAGQTLRDAQGADNGVRLLDLNADGYQDVVIGNGQLRATRLWSPERQAWTDGEFPRALVPSAAAGAARDPQARFGIVGDQRQVVLLYRDEKSSGAWRFGTDVWLPAPELFTGFDLDGQAVMTSRDGRDRGVRLVDLDGDGCCELLVANPDERAVWAWSTSGTARAAGVTPEQPIVARWLRLPYALPEGALLVDGEGRDAGLRLVDVDADLDLDVAFSNERRYGLHLFGSPRAGWDQAVKSGELGDADALPMIARHGTNNGAWFHGRELWVQNEDTARRANLVERRSFNDLLSDVVPPPKSPEAALAAMRPRDGFVVELMAAEPLTMDPIAFDWGPDGKLWVVEMADYPHGVGGKPGGRVRTLEDTDGDGRYDRSTLFLEGLRYPNSVLPWRKGILVAVAPDLLYAEDRDGDGRADVREVLFTGFGAGNPQHLFNGFTYGLDNWLYGANGDSGGHVKSLATGEEHDIGGRDFRFRPDDGRFDPQEGYSQFGRSRDDWGNWFGCSNANPMWQYVLADDYLRRNPHVSAPDGRVSVSVKPGVAPVYPASRLLERFNDPHTANRFTSTCSAMVYRDELFGPAYAGNTFVSEPVHNLVHREVMSREGLVFTSRRAADEQRSEFLASTDNWFRPTTLRAGPDGALWIADMYRLVIEHPEWIPRAAQKRYDLAAGRDKGRIYRVYPLGSTPRPIPRLGQLDTPALVATLESPSGWQRDKAQQLLVERQDEAAVAPLEALVGQGQRPTARLHALCTLEGLGRSRPEIVLTALEDSHPGVRRHAVRIAEPLLDSSPAVLAAVARLVDDPDPQVRLQLAYSLGACSRDAAGAALGKLAIRDAENPWIAAAVLSSATRNFEGLVAAVLAESRAASPPADLMANLLAVAAALDKPATIIQLMPIISRSETGEYALWQVTALAELLDLLSRRRSSLIEFRDGANNPLRTAIDQLEPLFAYARKVTADPATDEALRRSAVRLLGRGLNARAADVDALCALLVPQNPAELQAAAVAALGELNDERAAEKLLVEWKQYGPDLRRQVLDVLFSREAWLRRALAALEERVIPDGEIDASRRQQLLEHRAREIRERAAKLFAGSENHDRRQVIEAYQMVATTPGNAARGEELFQNKCAVCHRLADKGYAIGPNLAALTDKSPEALLIAILDPNRAVEAKFVSYTAVTASGLTYSGMLASETGNSVTLAGQEDKQQVILRTDLEALESTGKSLMPEGLEKDFAPADLADVIAYLRGNEARPREIAGNRPAVVEPESLRGYLFCLPTNCEIYGGSLRIEEANGNLGWWTGEDDHAVWTIEVPREMNYGVFLDLACDDTAAGSNWLLEVGTQRLTGKVEGTGDWNTYRRTKVGDVHLKPGRYRLGLRSNGKLRSPLFDLKSVTLIPFGRLVK